MSTSRGPGQAWWEMHLDAIAREGIGATAYAQREGLPVSSLYYWRRRLKALERKAQVPVKAVAAPVARQFVPVSVGPLAAVDHPVAADRHVLVLGAGLRLELSGLPSPQWLAQVRQALTEQVH
ncbi:IS66 family insertion sequence element accessory protein TnpA [Castellaniella sp.]|uniref:IS66 family insertion sequence element accessory protein TnpA n=1 Tax=Castellaniella sp. TaxID=1955812 RepID=UPI002AFE0896|nr:hypothetical protein [Castellaniella sp.]